MNRVKELRTSEVAAQRLTIVEAGEELMAASVLLCFVSAFYMLAFYLSSNPLRPSALVLNLAFLAAFLQVVTWIWTRVMLPVAPLWIVPSSSSKAVAVILTVAVFAMQYWCYRDFDFRQFSLVEFREPTLLDLISFFYFQGSSAIAIVGLPIGVYFTIRQKCP